MERISQRKHHYFDSIENLIVCKGYRESISDGEDLTSGEVRIHIFFFFFLYILYMSVTCFYKICGLSKAARLLKTLFPFHLEWKRFSKYKYKKVVNLDKLTEMRRKFWLVSRYSLKFTRCSLLVVKSLVTRYKICSLLVAEIARCKKSLVTRCKISSLLVIEVARCKKTLVTCCKICSLLIGEVARYKKSLVTRCKIRSLLVTEIVRCKKSLLLVAQFTCYLLQKLLVAKNYSSLVMKKTWELMFIESQ